MRRFESSHGQDKQMDPSSLGLPNSRHTEGEGGEGESDFRSFFSFF